MKSTVVFSVGENSYAYDSKNKYLFYLHPFFEIILQYKGNNKNAFKHINVSDEEIEYYYRKYKFLKRHGFFSEIEPSSLLNGAITKDMIKFNLTNISQIVFQVTNDCNMKCLYCCFGDLYNGAKQKISYMDIDMVHNVFSFLIPFWKYRKSSSLDTINIGFYGGEPLLNISLIKDIVSYCHQIQEKENIKFEFSMTTNATLLPKYIDFLVEHQFNLLISLDGNEQHSIYRVDRKNRPTFHKVFRNVQYVQERFKDYFQKKVFFNSVLTNKSNVLDVHRFIYNSFHKVPLIDPISTTDLKASKQVDFNYLSQKYEENVELLQERIHYSNIGKEIGRFFYYNLNNSFHHYMELLYSDDNFIYNRLPTGTCLPFGKKMYITSDGQIMACEKIAMSHILGHVSSQDFTIDLDKIADLYNL